MSLILPGMQYDHSFHAKKLGNWEIPAVRPSSATSAAPIAHLYGTGLLTNDKLKTRTRTTKPVVDDRGHLLPGVPKVKNSFYPQRALRPQTAFNPPPRWPQVNPTYDTGGTCTMGYKGIQTSYLPRTGSVTLTKVVPGKQEHVFGLTV